MLNNLFQFVLDNYITENSKVSNASSLYNTLIHEIPFALKAIIPHRNELVFKGSMGQGNKTDYPWISILNRSITSSTKYGLYIVYLFKKVLTFHKMYATLLFVLIAQVII